MLFCETWSSHSSQAISCKYMYALCVVVVVWFVWHFVWVCGSVVCVALCVGVW